MSSDIGVFAAGILRQWSGRLRARAGIVLLSSAVILVLLGLGRLSAGEAVAALVVAVAAAAVLPQRAATSRGPADSTTPDLGLAERTLRAFADALPDPCIVLDRRSLVLHCNPLAVQQFSAVAVGSPLAFSMRWPALLEAVEAVRRSGVAQTVELHLTVPTETWHRVSVTPLGSNGLVDGRLVIVLQSQTEQKRLAAMRTDFIANASHELRTPLTSLLGFIDTLLGPAARDAAAREKFLGIMRTQALRMSKLIDDLLSLSRIEMRQHVRPTGTVELGGLLREVGEGLQTQADQAGVALDLALPGEPAIVTGDRDELYEVFENLFDNAIKYGADGGRIDVALQPSTARPGFIVIVSDHGPGIEPEHVPRLTERFYRVDAESSRKKKGTGLGLAVVKHIVTRHRGTLEIASQPGQGTRVEVFLAR